MKCTRSKSAKSIIVVILISYFLFTIQHWNHANLPTEFSIAEAWGRQAIIQQGSLPEVVSYPTWTDALRNNAAQDIFTKIFTAFILIVSGETSLKSGETLLMYLPVMQIIVIPLSVIMVYRRFETNPGFSTVLLYLFAIFPIASQVQNTPSGLGARNILGKTIFILIFSLLIIQSGKKFADRRMSTIIMILIVSAFYFYHTWAYYLMFIIISFGIFGMIKHRIEFFRYLLSGLIGFGTSSVYLNVNQIREPYRLIAIFSELDSLQEYLFPTPSSEMAESYFFVLHPIFSTAQTINALLIVSIFVIFGLRFILSEHNDTYANALFTACIGLSGIATGLFIWKGVVGLKSRILEISVPVSFCIVAYQFSIHRKRFRELVNILVCLCVLVSSVSFVYYPPELTSDVSNNETFGLEFAGKYATDDNYIISDYRLGSAMALVNSNKDRFVSVDANRHTISESEDVLDAIYYQDDHNMSIIDEVVMDGHLNYFLVTSARQSEITIEDASVNRFRPASADFQNALSENSGLHKVYSDGTIEYHKRRNAN